MTKREVTKFRNRCVSRLEQIFGTDNVKKEWDVAKGSLDDLTRNLYCPRMDIAVGPFNISREVFEDQQRISRAYEENHFFMGSLNSRSLIRIREENACMHHYFERIRNQEFDKDNWIFREEVSKDYMAKVAVKF